MSYLVIAIAHTFFTPIFQDSLKNYIALRKPAIDIISQNNSKFIDKFIDINDRKEFNLSLSWTDSIGGCYIFFGSEKLTHLHLITSSELLTIAKIGCNDKLILNHKKYDDDKNSYNVRYNGNSDIKELKNLFLKLSESDRETRENIIKQLYLVEQCAALIHLNKFDPNKQFSAKERDLIRRALVFMGDYELFGVVDYRIKANTILSVFDNALKK